MCKQEISSSASVSQVLGIIGMPCHHADEHGGCLSELFIFWAITIDFLEKAKNRDCLGFLLFGLVWFICFKTVSYYVAQTGFDNPALAS